ncbi:MAG: hypothetical protein QFX32_02835 [Methanolinea sp.]|nr:hypothetical protein [Methanolinea sp.]
MSPAYRDPLLDAVLRRPEARAKIAFFFLVLQYLVYFVLVAGLLVFLYAVVTFHG